MLGTARYNSKAQARFSVACAAIVLTLLAACLPWKAAQAQEFETIADYAIVMDSRSGKVLFEKNADELVPPASMSKVMTMIMVFERLKQGRLKLTDEFTITEDAWRRGGAPSRSSTMYAEVGSKVSLENLIKGVVVHSGNDAAIAIAQAIGGTEDGFADDMTRRARELGLPKSTFKNATGLPAEGHLTTMRELASLTRYIIEVFPDYYKYYGIREFTWNNITQQNRNPLLGKYRGADGVKTGYIRDSGYGMIGSAEREGRRLIVVVGGMKSRRERAQEAERLLDFGFRKFRAVRLFSAGDTVGQARVWGGEEPSVKLVTKKDILTLLSEEEQATAEVQLVYSGPLKAPIKGGTAIGVVRILSDGKLVYKAPVHTKNSVPATDSMWKKALDSALFMALGG
ncbi:MAG: D-alanyl-D-alanine carboxypeptidase family protein [Pseudomonadota bacterium]